MTVHDFEIGDTWITDRGRKVEILASDHAVANDVSGTTVGVIAYRYHGMSMVHIRETYATTGWTKEVE